MYDNFYELLDVPRDASQDTIKTAYHEKIHEYHPDKNDDPNAQSKLDIVRIAYKTLSDQAMRNAYDELGHGEFTFSYLDELPDVEEWALTDLSEVTQTDPVTEGERSP